MKTSPFAPAALAVLLAACSTTTAPIAETPVAINTAAFTVENEPAFRELVVEDAKVDKLAGDLMFIEGPVWIPRDGGFLVFSDIPANELKKWTPGAGVTTFRAPSNSANGNTLDLQGRLVTAQHDGRLTRTEADGAVTTLIDSVNGKHLSSPNDVVVKKDGTIWFTDPDYGLSVGNRTRATPGNYVYRLNPDTKQATAVVTDTDRPNGLCFSPDEATLYIADSGMETHHIRKFSVAKDNSLTGGEVFVTLDNGAPDGIRCDEKGNIWSSSGDGAQIFAPSGQRIAIIKLPEAAANLEFGGPSGHTVYFTARTSLYKIEAKVGDARR